MKRRAEGEICRAFLSALSVAVKHLRGAFGR